jgi:osmotically-inducible protein OsmY
MTDDQIQRHIEDALDWADPAVDGSRIGVTVAGGLVTLRGVVDTHIEKTTAERVAMLVRGVNAVVNDLTVSPVAGLEPADTDIAQTAGKALNEAAAVQPNATVGDLRAMLEVAVLRTGEADVRSVHVNALGGRVILSGYVH